MMTKDTRCFQGDTGEQRAEALTTQMHQPGQDRPQLTRKKTMAEVAVKKTESFWDEIRKMEERVMRRAYDISQGNGSFGRDLDNWLEAERDS